MSRDGPGGAWTSHLGASLSSSATGAATVGGGVLSIIGSGIGSDAGSGVGTGCGCGGVWAMAGAANISTATVVSKERFISPPPKPRQVRDTVT